MARARTVALVACLALTAGCSGLTGLEATETRTVTPVDVPSATGTPASLPPGLTWGGIADLERLADAHASAAATRSYHWRERYVESAPVGPVNLTATHREDAWANDGTVRWDFRGGQLVDGEPTTSRYNQSWYSTGTVQYRFHEYDGGPEYQRLSKPLSRHRFAADSAAAVSQYLNVSNATVTPVARDGERLFRVVGRGPRAQTLDEARTYRAAAVVEPSGFVRELRVEMTVVIDERRRTISYRFVYVRVGDVPVPEPAWLDRARENVSQFRNSSTAPP